MRGPTLTGIGPRAARSRSVESRARNAKGLQVLEQVVRVFFGLSRTQALGEELEQRRMQLALGGKLRRIRGEEREDFPIIRHRQPRTPWWKPRVARLCVKTWASTLPHRASSARPALGRAPQLNPRADNGRSTASASVRKYRRTATGHPQ